MAADNPVPETATRSARVAAIPLISGRLRTNPNWAPEAVANDVAPPGDAVDTNANTASATIGSVIEVSISRGPIPSKLKIKNLIIAIQVLHLLITRHEKLGH